MPYGERCRVSSRVRGWFRNQKDRTNHPYQRNLNLKPSNLVKRSERDHALSMISGPKISTPMDSSKRELLDELLEIVNEMSSLHWKKDLSISMTSLSSSSEDISSSSSDDWEIVEPPIGGPPPPTAAPDHPPLKYVQFNKP
nr:ORF3 [Torque teno felis virus]